MTLLEIAKRVEKLASDNSPAILTGIAVVGTITTAVLAGRATIKATDIIDEAEREREQREISFALEPREKLALVWQVYLPPVGSAAATIACIICANRIGSRRAAAMAAAYSMSEKAFAEYRDKIVEKLGKNKEQTVRDDIAQDRMNRHPMPTGSVVILNGEVLCFDSLTGRYFTGNYENLRRAENDINFQINSYGHASLTEFYAILGLPPTKLSDELGWNLDNPLAVEFSAVMSDDGRPAVSISYHTIPFRKYTEA